MPGFRKRSGYPYGDRMIDENQRYYEDIEPERPNIAIVGCGKAKMKDWEAPVDIKHALDSAHDLVTEPFFGSCGRI